jgi:hypothetical protein
VAGAIVALGMLMGDANAALYYRGVLIAVALITAFSAFVTMSRFESGQRLFLCWGTFGAGYLLAALRYSLRFAALVTPRLVLSRPVLDGMLILQNVLIAVSLWLFVSAWRKTGLTAPVSRGVQVASVIGGIVVALAVGGFPLARGVATAGADSVLIVSTAGDIVGIALIMPLLFPALALRGGLLMHTWLYLALCEVVWLMYDVWLSLRPSLGLSVSVATGVEQVIRIVAIGFGLIASVAHRRAISGRG